MQHFDAQRIGPPVAVPASMGGGERARARTLVVRLCVHVSPPPMYGFAWTIRHVSIRSNCLPRLLRSDYLIDMITLRQFRYETAVVASRHFGKAADSCAVTQSSLPMHIREIERE